MFYDIINKANVFWHVSNRILKSSICSTYSSRIF